MGVRKHFKCQVERKVVKKSSAITFALHFYLGPKAKNHSKKGQYSQTLTLTTLFLPQILHRIRCWKRRIGPPLKFSKGFDSSWILTTMKVYQMPPQQSLFL